MAPRCGCVRRKTRYGCAGASNASDMTWYVAPSRVVKASTSIPGDVSHQVDSWPSRWCRSARSPHMTYVSRSAPAPYLPAHHHVRRPRPGWTRPSSRRSERSAPTGLFQRNANVRSAALAEGPGSIQGSRQANAFGAKFERGSRGSRLVGDGLGQVRQLDRAGRRAPHGPTAHRFFIVAFGQAGDERDRIQARLSPPRRRPGGGGRSSSNRKRQLPEHSPAFNATSSSSHVTETPRGSTARVTTICAITCPVLYAASGRH